MKPVFKEIFFYLKNDALAGTVTGIMAVPLTVGICLMSDYPIMTGLYTVIFAGIISFITYLFRPGNYTGMPGVAAGLAPALALGVHSFGMENMPFVILMTALFQALAWRFSWETYILRVVPHYLVEGLLAGVGLKIGLKFIPFLYDIEHETDTWLNLEREVVILLSIISFISFVLLFKYYKRKLPALPYIIILISSFALSFFFPLPMISIDHVPFELRLPLPHLDHMNGAETGWMMIKMIGFAVMLGTIDIIEQVMSNVAIEKMDPLSRTANSNNSLLAIWIANMGATFFGGMTNLDGLAKSTTNTVAGAKTKASNLFTSGVLLLVVLYPSILTHMPEYALGIIMVYSGWKMVANIANVRTEGRYALIMAGICGFLVFEFGIFEGLLILLFSHTVIQFIFMKRIGKTNKEIIQQLLTVVKEKPGKGILEVEDVIAEPVVPVFKKWVTAINSKDLNSVLKLYSDNATFIPAFSTEIKMDKSGIREIMDSFLRLDQLEVRPSEVHSQKINGTKVDSGQYMVLWRKQGFPVSHKLRFSFVIKDGLIVSHHSSTNPEEGEALGSTLEKATDYVE